MSSPITSRLAACVTSLDTVVAPAVSADDPLASEQVRLVARYIEFLTARLDHLTERSYFELGAYLAMGEEIAALLAEAGRPDAELARALAAASAVRDGPRRRPSAVDDVTAALRTAISRIARERASFAGDATGASIARLILDGSRPLVDLHRVWFLPLGLEPHPPHLPELEALL